MASSITITHNPLRLLGKQFLYVHAFGSQVIPLVKGGKYNCLTAEEGNLGVVEVVDAYDVQVFNLRPTVMLLSDGDLLLQDRLRAAGAYNTDHVQVCLLRFVNRKDSAFSALLNAQLPKAGLTIVRQGALIS